MTTIEPAELTCVCASLRMATRAVSRVYDDELRPAGLRTTQYSILSRLRAEGPETVTRLAARLGMDRTTLAREVAPLVRAGLVDRSAGEDRRRRVLALSAAGRERLDGARPGWERAQASLRAEFGEQPVEVLLQDLHLLVLATTVR